MQNDEIILHNPNHGCIRICQLIASSDVPCTDQKDRNALVWAQVKGHDEVVKVMMMMMIMMMIMMMMMMLMMMMMMMVMMVMLTTNLDIINHEGFESGIQARLVYVSAAGGCREPRGGHGQGFR